MRDPVFSNKITVCEPTGAHELKNTHGSVIFNVKEPPQKLTFTGQCRSDHVITRNPASVIFFFFFFFFWGGGEGGGGNLYCLHKCETKNLYSRISKIRSPRD